MRDPYAFHIIWSNDGSCSNLVPQSKEQSIKSCKYTISKTLQEMSILCNGLWEWGRMMRLHGDILEQLYQFLVIVLARPILGMEYLGIQKKYD
jgi:hypothetical protein